MRLPVATLMAQYPDVQAVVEAVRKDRIPCILPQVVFINCRIFVASAPERGEENESWFCAPPATRPAALLSRWRGTVWLLYFGVSIDGKPMDDEGSSGNFG
jgi:hypothetical protein